MAALRLMLRYYDPSYVPRESDLLSSVHRVSFRQRTGGAVTAEGRTPLAPDVRSRIATLLATLVSTDTDASIRKAALTARQVLAFADPVNTPVPTGAITLIAGCADRVTLRSTADIDLPVRISVLGTPFRNDGGIRAGSGGKPSEILFGLPRGTVVATLGGRELARLSERTAPCAPGQVRGRARS